MREPAKPRTEGTAPQAGGMAGGKALRLEGVGVSGAAGGADAD